MATKNSTDLMATSKKIRSLIFIICAILNGCASKLSGQIENQAIIDFSEARVNITGIKNSYRTVIAVNQKGDFSVSDDVPDGLYLLEIIQPGFRVFSKKITIEGSKFIKARLSPLSMPNKKLSRIRDQLDMSRASGVVSLTPPRM